MATKRIAKTTEPVDYLQEMTAALSTKSRPRCFRPFETEGVVGLFQPNEAQKMRMTKIASSLSETQTRKAMLEILWAMPNDALPYQVAPELNLGQHLQTMILNEAERRGVLKIIRKPSKQVEGYETLHYRPVKMPNPLTKQEEKELVSYIERMTATFYRSLPPLYQRAFTVFVYGQYLSEEMFHLLPPEDRFLLRQSLPAELVARIETELGDEAIQGEMATKGEEDKTGETTPSEERMCEVYQARHECAYYRWIQAQEASAEVQAV